ncbi:MAG TPA: outer membrane lipoprotein carrier protein LolA [Myxococcota bacterium]|nr:outer membrane lipoprotein carrier protein LolA [Myxococcota bacterium]
MRSSSARPRTSRFALSAALALAVLGAGADDPQKTLDAVQKRYDAIQDIRADFEQTSFSAALGKETKSAGSVVVKRPGKMRWEYAKPDGRVIVLDGSTIRIWNPDEKQLQIAPLSPENVSPTALGFLMGQASLKDSFDAKSASEPGRPERGIVLTPKQDASFETLTLWLDPKTLQLRESVVVDLFGNKTRVRLEKVAENRGVDGALFELTAPPGAETVDLRR